jgi:hypothetical protein
MKVLSLFDGMSCGRIALDRARICVGNGWTVDIVAHILKNIVYGGKYERY